MKNTNKIRVAALSLLTLTVVGGIFYYASSRVEIGGGRTGNVHFVDKDAKTETNKPLAHGRFLIPFAETPWSSKMSGLKAVSAISAGCPTEWTQEDYCKLFPTAESPIHNTEVASASIPWNSASTLPRSSNAGRVKPDNIRDITERDDGPTIDKNAEYATRIIFGGILQNSIAQRTLWDAAAAESDTRFCTAALRGADGSLWVGTEGNGVWRYNGADRTVRKFTTGNGLGDDYCYAMDIDSMGRIWIGHLNHGVSVYLPEGRGEWRNYEAVGGLTKPSSRNGPLGERVNAIKASRNGDVWIATNAGLSRYSERAKKWSYYARCDGLPSNDITSIAIDDRFNVYIGLACEGISIGSAENDYQSWRHISANKENNGCVGVGIPSDDVNAVLVSRYDGGVWMATRRGIGFSNDRGNTWIFIRRGGSNEVSIALDAIPGPIKRIAEGGGLNEDYCTTLGEQARGLIWIGHRDHNPELLFRDAGEVRQYGLEAGGTIHATAIVCQDDESVAPILIGYGNGIYWPAVRPRSLVQEAPRNVQIAQWPVPAESLSDQQIGQEIDVLRKSAMVYPDKSIVALDDDWLTRGEWLGRLGRHTAILAAMSDKGNYVWGCAKDQARCSVRLGREFESRDALRYWRHWLYTSNLGSLEMPQPYYESRVSHGYTSAVLNQRRRQAEWDDHGEVYPRDMDGPDLDVSIRVDEGLYRVALYDMNKDVHDDMRSRSRDYDLSISTHDKKDGIASQSDIAGQPVGSMRIKQFYGGVYKQMLICGPKEVSIRIRRSASINAILSGVFVDTIEESPFPYSLATPSGESKSAVVKSSSESGDHAIEDNLIKAGAVLREQMTSAGFSSESVDRRKRLAVQLLRTIVSSSGTNGNIDAIPVSQVRNAETCCFVAGYYEAWEALQRRRGAIPARDVERGLHWDQNIPNYSGNGFGIIVAELEKKYHGDNHSDVGK